MSFCDNCRTYARRASVPDEGCGGHRSIGKPNPESVSCPCEWGRNGIGHRLFPAKEMVTAGGFQHKSVQAIEGNKRGIANHPPGKLRQRRLVCGPVNRRAGKSWHTGGCIAEREAGLDPSSPGWTIGSNHTHPPSARLMENKGLGFGMLVPSLPRRCGILCQGRFLHLRGRRAGRLFPFPEAAEPVQRPVREPDR